MIPLRQLLKELRKQNTVLTMTEHLSAGLSLHGSWKTVKSMQILNQLYILTNKFSIRKNFCPTCKEYTKMAKSIIAVFPSTENKANEDQKWVRVIINFLLM